MKKISLVLFLFVSSIVFAKTKHYGPSVIEKTKIDSEMVYYGPVTIGESDVKKDIEIFGPLNITQSKVFGKLEISGPLMSENTKFENKISIKGPIFASNSIFKNEVEMYTRSAKFDDSKIMGKLILINKEDKNPYICLQKGSELSSVEFKGNKGKIYVTDKKSKIDRLINGDSVSAECPEK